MKRTRIIRFISVAAMSAVAAIALLLASMGLDHRVETILPAPTGPFTVGRTTFVWSDAAHTDPTAPQPGTKRELAAWIWYPAAPSKPSQALAEYLPGPWRAAVERQRVRRGGGWHALAARQQRG